jgi:hypothetical protein
MSTTTEEFYKNLGMDVSIDEPDFEKYYSSYAQALADRGETTDETLNKFRRDLLDLKEWNMHWSGSQGTVRVKRENQVPQRFAEINRMHRKLFDSMLQILEIAPALINDIIMARWKAVSQSRLVKEVRKVRSEAIEAGTTKGTALRKVTRYEKHYRNYIKDLVDSGEPIPHPTLETLAKVYAGVQEVPRGVYLEQRRKNRKPKKAKE